MNKLEFNEDGSIKIPEARDRGEKNNFERSLKIATSLFGDYKNKAGVFSEFKFPPEYNLPPGMKRGSEDQLRYITLTVSFDYMRDAEVLWKQSFNSWIDEKTRWIFNPKKVVENGKEELIKVLKEINDQRPNKDGLIWFTICKKLKDYNFQIFNLIESLDLDAIKINNYLEENKKSFPYLNGYKIKPLWLRIIDETVGIRLKGIKEIPIPIDVHTARMTLKIVFGEKFSGKIDKKLRKRTQNIWKEILKDEEIYPLQLDEPLWLLGKYNLLDKFMENHDFQ